MPQIACRWLNLREGALSRVLNEGGQHHLPGIDKLFETHSAGLSRMRLIAPYQRDMDEGRERQ